MAGPAGFVGREGELSRLLGALGGDARLVLVVGDAGVGKTRFVTVGMDRAAVAGTVMVRGECLPLSGTLPMLPVADALAELARLEDGRLLAAALDAAPGYARQEVARLVPGLDPAGGTGPGGRDGAWSRERLFAGAAEALAAMAGESPAGLGLVVEDVHWADSETLDFLTFLGGAAYRDAVTVVVTCRGDEAPLAEQVAGWLAQVRADAGVAEIRLGPLSRAQVAGQARALAAGPVSPRVVDELYARAEGNPFFTEQLVAAGLAGGAAGRPDGTLRRGCAGGAGGAGGRGPAGGRGRAGRGDRAGGGGGAAGVAGAGGGPAAGRGRCRWGAPAPARAAGRGGGRRVAARGAGGAARARGAGAGAGRGPGAGRGGGRALAGRGPPGRGIPGPGGGGRSRRAGVRLRPGGGALAAGRRAGPDPAGRRRGRDRRAAVVRAGHRRVFPRGRPRERGLVAEQAYRRFAGHPDPATAAVICHRTAVARVKDAPRSTGLPLMEEALRLFEQAPPSSEHADALLDYVTIFLLYAEDRLQAGRVALDRALEIAEAAGATALIPRTLSVIAFTAFVHGQVADGLAALERGWALARAARDGPGLVWLAVNEGGALLKLAQFQRAADVASRGLDDARQAGLQSWDLASRLAAFVAEALVALGRTAEAAALIDPQTTMPPHHDQWLAQVIRAEVDLLRGDTGAATERWQLIAALSAVTSRVDFAYDSVPRAVEAMLWTGRPGEALRETRRALALFKVPDLTILSGRLLAAGMRACADLAGQARARHDQQAARDALTAADSLATWVGQMGGAPFADHSFVAANPAQRATWDAE